MRDHKNLRVFELADELVIAIYQLTRHFPTDEKFGITSQLRRAAISIASNIVEGCSRESQNDFGRFIEIAFGSAREVEYQLSVAERLKMADQSQFVGPSNLAVETCKVLNGLLRSIRNRN